MRYVVIIACAVYHSSAGICFIVDEFVSRIIVGHYRIVIVLLNTIVIPYLKYSQRHGSAELMMLGQRAVELREPHQNRHQKDDQQDGKSFPDKDHAAK